MVVTTGVFARKQPQTQPQPHQSLLLRTIRQRLLWLTLRWIQPLQCLALPLKLPHCGPTPAKQFSCKPHKHLYSTLMTHRERSEFVLSSTTGANAHTSRNNCSLTSTWQSEVGRACPLWPLGRGICAFGSVILCMWARSWWEAERDRCHCMRYQLFVSPLIVSQ